MILKYLLFGIAFLLAALKLFGIYNTHVSDKEALEKEIEGYEEKPKKKKQRKIALVATIFFFLSSLYYIFIGVVN